MKAVPIFAAVAAGWLLISKLTKRSKGSKQSDRQNPEATKLANIIEEQDEVTPSHKRPASGSPNPANSDDQHKIKAQKMQRSSPPATPLVLKTTSERLSPAPEPAESEQATEDVEAIPSPPPPAESPISSTPPEVAPIAATSAFQADSTTQDSATFDDGNASVADSQDSSLSRGGGLRRLGSKVKVQMRKLGRRPSSSS
jgi:hypothetical protein